MAVEKARVFAEDSIGYDISEARWSQKMVYDLEKCVASVHGGEMILPAAELLSTVN